MLDPLPNRDTDPTTLTNRRPGRPRADTQAPRLESAPVVTDPHGRRACPRCGRGSLIVIGAPRKSDGAKPVRCTHCSCTGALLPSGVLA
jgi:hypothetical protein